jgi:hypothetical protein
METSCNQNIDFDIILCKLMDIIDWFLDTIKRFPTILNNNTVKSQKIELHFGITSSKSTWTLDTSAIVRPLTDSNLCYHFVDPEKAITLWDKIWPFQIGTLLLLWIITFVDRDQRCNERAERLECLLDAILFWLQSLASPYNTKFGHINSIL